MMLLDFYLEYNSYDGNKSTAIEGNSYNGNRSPVIDTTGLILEEQESRNGNGIDTCAIVLNRI